MPISETNKSQAGKYWKIYLVGQLVLLMGDIC